MPTGRVYLVGAGPGDPGLISLRAVECLRLADIVLYDGLVTPLVLRHTRAECERTCRVPSGGSTATQRVLRQDQINEQLVAHARQGKTVVRLKGGDPFIFGRGSEEAAFLRRHGIEYEIVPGITAAVAAGEYAGFSLTHRDCASMVTFVTGHESPDKLDSAVDYEQLAKLPGTLVFYMGLHRLPQIVESLLQHGRTADSLAAVICRATTPLQRTVTSTLSELPAVVANAGLVAPSLIVVGDCVRQREELAWFEQRPLFGQRIGITRPIDQADPQIQRAIQLGAQPLLMPTITIRPVDDWSEVDTILNRLHDFDWLVFTSPNGVQSLLGRLWESGGDARRLGTVKIATIGPSTAESLAAYHLRTDLVPDEFRGEALAASLVPHVAGKRVLWARASRGRDVLPRELAAAGATVEQVVVYHNEDAVELPVAARQGFERHEVDWIGMSSPSIARSLATLLPDTAKAGLGTWLRLASISPVTSTAAREAGLPVHAEATIYTWEGIFTAIEAARQL